MENKPIIRIYLATLIFRVIIAAILVIQLIPSKSENRSQIEIDHQILDSVVLMEMNYVIDRSIRRDQEWGGLIFHRNGKFVPMLPHTSGEKHRINFGIVKENQFIGKFVAMYHTHGAESEGYDDEHFSTVDTLNSQVVQYLITPQKKVLKFDTRDRRIYVRTGKEWTLQHPHSEAHREYLVKAESK